MSSLIACADSLPGLRLEKECKDAHALTSQSLWSSGEVESQNGDETVGCGPRATLVELSVRCEEDKDEQKHLGTGRSRMRAESNFAFWR